MLTKILLTLLIIIGALFYIKARSRNRALATVAQQSSTAQKRQRPVYYLALIVILIMLSATGYYLFWI